MATQMAVAAVEACKANGYNVSAHVLGREGQVIVAMRNENASIATFENSMKKAYTARSRDRTTRASKRLLHEPSDAFICGIFLKETICQIYS